MHIEPGVVDGAKMGLAYATAAGAAGVTMKLAYDAIKEAGALALAARSLIATALVFAFFEILPHYPVGVSEVHFILGSTLYLLFGAGAAGVGLAAGDDAGLTGDDQRRALLAQDGGAGLDGQQGVALHEDQIQSGVIGHGAKQRRLPGPRRAFQQDVPGGRKRPHHDLDLAPTTDDTVVGRLDQPDIECRTGGAHRRRPYPRSGLEAGPIRWLAL